MLDHSATMNQLMTMGAHRVLSRAQIALTLGAESLHDFEEYYWSFLNGTKIS